MATLCSTVSGNFTAAATWGLIDTTSLSNSEAIASSSTTAFVSSAGFIPGMITVDGIGLKVLTRSTTLGGTISVRLAITGVAVGGTTVTINVNDIPFNCAGWIFFKFSSPVTLMAATTYNVQISSSVNASVSVYRTATAGDWSRFLRTTTTQAPVAADTLFVCGEYISAGVNNELTVTMNNTSATVFGRLECSGQGFLNYGTSASTNYQLICEGDILINGDSKFYIGSSGSRMPSSSTAILQANQNAVNVNYTISTRGTGDFQTWGNNKTWRTLLNGSVAAGATTLISTDTTGWTTGEEILIASTTRTTTETEIRTLAVNSSGTTITVPALSFAHAGVVAQQAELANITRNVKVRGQSATLQSYMQCALESHMDFNDTEFQFFGSGAANRRGFDIFPTTASTGVLNIQDCCFKNWESNSSLFLTNQATNDRITINGCVFYRMFSSAITTAQITSTGVTISNCWAFTNLSANPHFNLAMQGGTVSNLRAISSVNNGITISNTNNVGITYNNLVCHSNGATGVTVSARSISENYFTLTNIDVWRNNTRGLFLSSCSRVNVDTVTCYGNTNNGLEIATCNSLTLNNIISNGGLTLVQPVGIDFATSSTDITVDNSFFGATLSHSTASIRCITVRQWQDAIFRNCLFADTTEIATQNSMAPGAFIGSSKHDQTNTIHKMWRKYGTITADASITANAPLSVRITPTSSVYKTGTMIRTFAVPSGKQAKVTVFVRRSIAGDGSAYNGSLPNLILKENTAAGVSSDTILATATVSSLGAFEAISGITPVATDNTIFTVCIDCNGSAGWVNLDNWKLEILDGSANSTNVNNENFWTDGQSFQGVNTMLTNNSNTDTYWYGGQPATELYPVSNSQTGRFFLLFDE